MPIGDDVPEQTLSTLITPDMYNFLVQTVNYLLRGNMVGFLTHAWRTTDIDEHWLICDGRTIGSASSGGTARANADMEVLFTHLWNNSSNTYLVIQTSAGSNTTRGASAAADFAANKRMPLPDARGRTLISLDGSAGVVAGTWADNLGGTGGDDTHQLTLAELASHIHPPASTFLNIIGAGPGTSNLTTGGSIAGSLSGTGSAGGDTPHNNMQPSLVVSILMCTGV